MDRERLASMLMSEGDWFARALENLEASDPDYVVDVLGLTTEDIIDKFYGQVRVYLQEEYEIVNGTYED